MDKSKQKITHITMLCQILLNRLHDYVAENNFSKGLKYTAQNFLRQLSIVERKRYDKFYEHDETASDMIYTGMDEFYKTVSEVEIENMNVASQLLKLLKDYPIELESVVNQVLNKKQ